MNDQQIDDAVRECVERMFGQYRELGGWTKGPFTERIRELVRRVRDAERERMTQAARDVLAERRGQIDREGWSTAHDDEHTKGEMRDAAVCYLAEGFKTFPPPPTWPWDRSWWKPRTYRENLIRAAALVIAEIERIDRAAIRAPKMEREA